MVYPFHFHEIKSDPRSSNNDWFPIQSTADCLNNILINITDFRGWREYVVFSSRKDFSVKAERDSVESWKREGR